MSAGETISVSAAPARAPKDRLSDCDIERLILQLRVGMEKLASNACDMTMPDRIVLRPQLREFCPADDSTIHRWMNSPTVRFPRSFEVSGRLKGWSMAELMRWYILLLESRDQQGGAS